MQSYYPRIGFSIDYYGSDSVLNYYRNFNSTLISPVCQVYLSHNNKPYETTFLPEDLSRLKQYFNSAEGSNNSLHIHTPLLINLANKSKPHLIGLGISSIRKLLNQISDMPSSAVLHFGSTCDSGSTVETVGQELNRLITGCSNEVRSRRMPVLLIENSAGSGTKLGNIVDEFRRLFEVLDQSSPVGICLDTQHSFGAGSCSWSNNRIIDQYFEEFDSIRPNVVRLMHLNDSTVKFGSHADKHQMLCQGEIFQPGPGGNLRRVLDNCLQRNIELICETPRKPYDNYEIDWAEIRRALS